MIKNRVKNYSAMYSELYRGILKREQDKLEERLYDIILDNIRAGARSYNISYRQHLLSVPTLRSVGVSHLHESLRERTDQFLKDQDRFKKSTQRIKQYVAALLDVEDNAQNMRNRIPESVMFLMPDYQRFSRTIPEKALKTMYPVIWPQYVKELEYYAANHILG